MNKPTISFTKKTKVITLCLFTATVFWFFHAMNKNHKTTISYPVKVEIEKKTKSEPVNKTLSFHITVSGNGWSILQKKMGWGLSPLHIEASDSTSMVIPSNNHMRQISNSLKSVHIDFIHSQTFYF